MAAFNLRKWEARTARHEVEYLYNMAILTVNQYKAESPYDDWILAWDTTYKNRCKGAYLALLALIDKWAEEAEEAEERDENDVMHL